MSETHNLQEAKRRGAFIAVVDPVMTDTARYADVVLPATTFLEHHDIRRAYGSYVVDGIVPVIERLEESRPDSGGRAEGSSGHAEGSMAQSLR